MYVCMVCTATEQVMFVLKSNTCDFLVNHLTDVGFGRIENTSVR